VGTGFRFEPPTLRRPELARPRLLDRLRLRFTARVALVVAPAGFGKTTLLAQAVAENRLVGHGEDRWLTCHGDDAAASSLYAGLCGAVGVDPVGETEPRVEPIVEAVWHRSPDEVALVLDDVHEIAADSAGFALLAELVTALPRNGHLVLAGRRPPALPLARMEVGGQLVRIDESDLQFTDSELAAFAAERSVPPSQVAGCGGWPALAEIAASSVPGVDVAYVWEEVMARLDSSRRRDLTLLAHLGTFDADLAEAALGHPVDLDRLTAGFPLVGHAAGGGWAIHSLWQPLLAREVDAADLAEVWQRAGLALAGRRDVAAAVRLLSQAEAWDAVTGVVADALGAALPPVPGDIVTAWLGRLPSDHRESPLGRLLDAVGAVQTEPDLATERLEAAAVAFRDHGNHAGELACIAQLAQLAWWSEQPERLAALAARVFALEAAGDSQAAPLAGLARALVADVANDSAAALDHLTRIPAGSFNQDWQSLVDWLRSTSLNHLGRASEALAAAELACRRAGPLHQPLVETARLQALWFLGHTDEVVDQFPALVDRAGAIGLRNYTALMAASCAVALAVTGRRDEAAGYLDRARHAAVSRDVPLVDVNLSLAEAMVAVESGDEGIAAQVLRDSLTRSPLLGSGHAAAPQQRTLALWYVLVPETRPTWEQAPLGPVFRTARELARSVAAVRDGAIDRLRTTAIPAASLVRAHLPLAWSTELALALIEAQPPAGWDLLAALWPAAQVHVRRHATLRARVPARAALTRLPHPPTAALELRLLGPVELRRAGVPVASPEWRRTRVRSLLAHLVVHESTTRDRLADDLWPELDGYAQSRNLRISLTYLLRVLEPDRADREASFFVRSHGNTLVLYRGDHLTTDLWEFDDLWSAATAADRSSSPTVALDAMRRAVALWRDDPGELANEEWALAEVEERRLRLVDLAARAAELSLARGDPEEARRLADTALRVDPWSERAHYIAVAARHAVGDDHAARRALARYQDSLRELGIDPSVRSGRIHLLADRVLAPGTR
jgi:DNA-binding SARP family transcriptional activator